MRTGCWQPLPTSILTLVVKSRFHNINTNLNNVEVAFGIDQEWLADTEAVGVITPMEGMEMML